MPAKLIDLSFTLNGRKVKVQIAPDTMLFSLVREQGCASVRCACETTNCGLCTVWLDGDPVLSCSVPAARVEGRSVTTLEGLKAANDDQRKFLHRGLAERNFERRFQLADYVVVTEAALADGLLSISLKRELPEALKPRQIEITTSVQPNLIEGEKAA